MSDLYCHRFKLRHVDDIKSLEKVAIAVSVKGGRRGDISLWLRSPAGTPSHLMTCRPKDDNGDGWTEWTLSTNAFFGEERVNGEWILGMQNYGSGDMELISWRLTFFGSSAETKSMWDPDGWARRALHSRYPPSPTYFQEESEGGAWSDEEYYQPRSMDDEWPTLSGYFSSDFEGKRRHWHRTKSGAEVFPWSPLRVKGRLKGRMVQTIYFGDMQ